MHEGGKRNTMNRESVSQSYLRLRIEKMYLVFNSSKLCLHEYINWLFLHTSEHWVYFIIV